MIYQGELRWIARAAGREQRARREDGLRGDPRNMVPVARECHERHHSGARRLALKWLPDSVFEFAAAEMGPRSYDYLVRRYAGDDERLEGLLDG